MLPRKLGILCAVLTGLAAIALLVQAQTTGGTIRGRVVDEAGRPVPGALLEVRGPALQAYLGSATDVEGEYNLPFVPAGKGYEVKVEAPGYATVVRKGIDVPLGVTVTLPFTLGAGKTEVLVTAASPTVDVKSSTAGTSIAGSMITSIPLERNYRELAYLAPTAVNGGVSTPTDPSIAGSTGAENSYLINGLDVTNPRMGTNGADLNFDFIQEMQVLTGGLPPEYGSTMGGVVNAITRSGGNEYHGSLFAYYWSDQTQAKQTTPEEVWAGMGNDGFKRYDLGGTLGGYFVKDKLWFYLAYDYNKVEQYTAPPVGPEYGDQYLYLNGAPAQSAFAGQHFTSQSSANQMYAFKLTWNASPNQKLAFSFFGNDLSGDDTRTLATLSPESAKLHVKASASYLTLQWNATWSPRFFTEADVGYQDRSTHPSASAAAMADYPYDYAYSGFQALPKENTVAPVRASGLQIDLGSNYRPVSSIGSLRESSETSWQARLKLTNLFSGAGRHELSYGLQALKTDLEDTTRFSGPPYFSPSANQPATGLYYVEWFASQSPGPQGERYRYLADARISPARQRASTELGAGWVNDDWSITDSFTLKLGLRYERQKIEGEDTGIAINLSDNWAPRLGFAWDVMHDGKSKLYGFVGRYFERVPMEMALIYLDHEIKAYDYFYNPELTRWTGSGGITIPNVYIQGQITPPASQLTSAEVAAFSHKLKAPYTDEFILGYQYQIRPDLTLGARAIYRELGRTIDDLYYRGGFVIANPDEWTRVPVTGRRYPGATFYYPKPVRRYEALELTLDKRFSDRWQLSGSLVYSSLKGNYEGVANNDYGGDYHPNLNPVYDGIDWTMLSYGYLPLDRNWVFKTFGSYFFEGIPLQISGVLNIQSGTPISRMIQPWFHEFMFATSRGSYGRTPWTWSLDLGLQYDFKLPMKSRLGVRLDVFNVTNEQKATSVNQIWAFQPRVPGPLFSNPDFGNATSYQPPRTVRFALRWTF